MRNRILSRSIAIAITFLFSHSFVWAQSTGYINRSASSSAGDMILDPNNDNYTSATNAGFNGNDVTNSELPYRSVPSFSTEPFGDLRRGPDHNYSDFVPDANSVGYYAYYDGTNLLFRFRMGSIMPGSKGYSVLLDTDGKFGVTGTNADPNYQPATTGTNGNPGFEIEIVLETNFRIAIYNVDGSSSATLVKQYTNWQDMSQVSIAGTFDNGDPDFFIDFYIPFSDLTASPFSLTSSTALRMSATTVMSPQAAIGGPKSDIYGLTDDGYNSTNNQYEAYINAQPSFTTGGLTSVGFGAMCTAAPTVNSPISTGTVNISGTWTKSSLTGALNTAIITVYKNGTSVGTVANVATGSAWILNSISVANGDVIRAKAQASGESMCLTSNSVTVQGCNTSNIPSTTSLALTCVSTRGIEGTYLSGNQVKVYWINPTTLATSVIGGPTASSPTFGYSGTNFYYNHTDYNGSQIPSACSGGSQDMPSGNFYITTVASGSTCESAPLFSSGAVIGCVGLGGTTTATPTITQTALYNSSTQVSGTATTGAQVQLRINGQLIATTTATGGNYSFTGLTLVIGDIVDVRALTTNSCISSAASLTVTCYTTPPIITSDNNNQITAGQSITGTSSEPSGTTIRVYTSPANTLVSTISVQSGGTWNTGAYTAVSGTSYYATAQNGTCGVSTASGIATAASATTGRCGTITGPVVSSDGSVSGTITGSVSNTTVNLYLDDILIGSTTTSNTSWNISVSNLYNNGVLKIGVREGTNQEQICSSSATTIACSSGPVNPVFTPTNSAINSGQFQTYTISNAVAGAFYGISDASTGASLGTGVWATSSTVNLTTTNLTTNSYTVAIKGTALSGVSICSSSPVNASLLVSSVLPLNMIDFTAKKLNSGIQLQWITESERNTKSFEIERSGDGTSFNKISEKASKNTRSRNTYYFLDEAPLPINYYRLKMVDEDGKYSYSKIVVVNQTTTSVSKVQPNPFIQSFVVNTFLPSAQPLKVQLLDMNGSLIRYKSVNGLAGENRIEFNDLGNLQAGMYMVRIVRLDSVTEQKIIKARP